jgi:hypothetical protein
VAGDRVRERARALRLQPVDDARREPTAAHEQDEGAAEPQRDGDEDVPAPPVSEKTQSIEHRRKLRFANPIYLR